MTGKRLAFVAGSNGPSGLNPLKYARSDAKGVTTILSGPRCGFDVSTPPQGATANAVRQQLSSIIEECSEQDVFVCYYSGHGLLEQGSLYLLWDESKSDRLRTSALPVSQLMEDMRYCKARNKMLILDCCHAGAAAASLGLKSLQNTPVEDVLQDSVKPDNFIVLAASSRLERAREFDNLGGSFLTHNLCSALGSEYDEVADPKKHRVSIEDLKQWLDKKAVQQNSLGPDHSVPVPYFFGQWKGDLILTVSESDWVNHEIQWLDGTIMVVLPIQPIRGMAFCIGKHPITNKQYRSITGLEPEGQNFVKSILPGRSGWRGPFNPFKDSRFNDPEQPVVCTSFGDCQRYIDEVCERDLGSGRDTVVPSPNVWDFAAFGTEFPDNNPATWMSVQRVIHDRAEAPASIDLSGARANTLGISDLIGNVWEWCLDRDRRHRIAVLGPSDFDLMPDLRGGGFFDNLSEIRPFLDVLTLPKRETTRHSDLGFRIGGLLPVSELPDGIQNRLLTCRKLSRFTGFATPLSA